MVRWAMTVIETSRGEHIKVIDEITGTREQALARLWHHAVHLHSPDPVAGSNEQWVLRDGDDGFIVIRKGLTGQYSRRFRIHEIVWHGMPPR
ncbi:hypothetical protein LO772_18370 [Yinghuangia sp. ASG 101]|uniref:hypothetical protein n=1 Tax=Yinghuangia sp. ASG 101 TaxID=2896848 RepID=UPI001E433FE8|nr:hypothetical protein [Yinghuangia sp. ASG 101]UGQ08948.1 hypothetical protein LO772_18370 [Yinghuangia sp. ASG 101]